LHEPDAACGGDEGVAGKAGRGFSGEFPEGASGHILGIRDLSTALPFALANGNFAQDDRDSGTEGKELRSTMGYEFLSKEIN
jgi:hypothetical protein